MQNVNENVLNMLKENVVLGSRKRPLERFFFTEIKSKSFGVFWVLGKGILLVHIIIPV